MGSPVRWMWPPWRSLRPSRRRRPWAYHVVAAPHSAWTNDCLMDVLIMMSVPLTAARNSHMSDEVPPVGAEVARLVELYQQPDPAGGGARVVGTRPRA